MFGGKRGINSLQLCARVSIALVGRNGGGVLAELLPRLITTLCELGQSIFEFAEMLDGWLVRMLRAGADFVRQAGVFVEHNVITKNALLSKRRRIFRIAHGRSYGFRFAHDDKPLMLRLAAIKRLPAARMRRQDTMQIPIAHHAGIVRECMC
jgi:hypothetical protein